MLGNVFAEPLPNNGNMRHNIYMHEYMYVFMLAGIRRLFVMY
jgi:hypothetical protein